MALHQVDVGLRFCPRTVALCKGRVVYDGSASALAEQMLRELYVTEAEDILGGSNTLMHPKIVIRTISIPQRQWRSRLNPGLQDGACFP